jgi:hypothetical protein
MAFGDSTDTFVGRSREIRRGRRHRRKAFRRQLLSVVDAMTTQAKRWPRAVAAAARARIWDERRSAAAAREASRFRRQRMKARVRAFVLFERRQLTKFTRAESWRVLDMDFLEDGMFVA